MVLIALALIFLPIIFDGEGSYESEISSRIPAVPIITPMQDPVPTRPVVLANQPGFGIAAPVEEITTPADESNADERIDDTPSEIETPPELAETAAVGLAEIRESQPSFQREAPQLGADGLPQGWSVRLGTFSDENNASQLLERLLEAGYKAYSREIDRGQDTLTAVFVGPWLDRARVDSYQSELQNEFNLAGYVVKYTIGDL